MTMPDAVALVRAYLAGLHGSITVSSETPNPIPNELITIRRVGGGGFTPVRDVARLDIFCWSTTSALAGTLATTVRGEMHLLHRSTLGGIDCYRVEETLFRQFDDPESGKPRYWMTFALTLRANEIRP